MATRKSPSRGTGSRPAKATISKTRSTAKKPLKVSPKTDTPEPESSKPESNVVPLTAAEAAEPAPVVEDVVAETPETAPEPAPVEDVKVLESAAEEAPEDLEDDGPVIDETVEETKVEASWPFGFSSASLFQGFPQMPQFPQMPNLGDFPKLGAVDMNAYVASGTALAEGMRSLGEEMVDFSRKTAERNVETSMAMFGAASVEEVVSLQSRHAMGSMDELMNESAKLTGMAIDVANKAAAPFTRG